MLKVKSIRDEPGDLRVFEIVSDGAPASPEDLARVARVAVQLIEENQVGGRFAAGTNGSGILELHIAPARRTFFHDGIVFAALDAVNDPIRSPTLTRLTADGPFSSESPKQEK
jgi:hypothetical protein